MIDQNIPTFILLGRQLNDMALTAGRKRQSAQTGYVHYFYHDSEDDAQQTIPLIENVYFALALLRTKTSENVTEAKEILNRLLFFQNPTESNFPIYIHEYPHCKDRFLGVQLLPAFFFILDEFDLVLGADLKQRLHLCVSKLLHSTLKALDEKKPSYALGIKIAAAAKAFGIYFEDLALEQKGEQLLNQYLNMGLQPAWFIPTSIADICIALQLAYASIQESPWKDFWQHLIQTWHLPTCAYIGPGLKQHQQADEPQPALYDLMMGYFSQGFSQRALRDAPYHLHAVLIRPIEEFFPVVTYPLSIKGLLNQCPWTIYQQEKFAYSLIDSNALPNPAHKNAFHPLAVVWGDKDKVHSFVCQEGNFDSFTFESNGHEIELVIQLSPDYELDDREKAREIAFFFDIEPDVKMTIHGEAATTFDLSEEFILKTPQVELSLVISHTQGEGQFLGHLMQGNRSSQIHLKGAHRFKAYDWQLFFRTLRRSSTCQFKASLRIQPCQK